MVGTELTKILSWFGLKHTPSCPCRDYAKLLDRYGVAWAESHSETVVMWMRTEARRRRLPFSDAVGRSLVAWAIRRAKKTS
jgi:hypothetical protein